MHPDVPRWAREILEREVTHVSFTSFHVLKDSMLHKLGVGYTPTRETYVLLKTPAGGELFRVQVQASERELLDAVFRALAPEHAAEASTVTCASCQTTFTYWWPDGAEAIHCSGCGAPITAHPEPSPNGGGADGPEPVQRA